MYMYTVQVPVDRDHA